MIAISLHARLCCMILPVLLAACGPGKGDGDGDAGSDDGGDISDSDSATGNLPTGDVPGGVTSSGATSSGGPPGDATSSGGPPGDVTSSGGPPDDMTSGGGTSGGDDDSTGQTAGSRMIGFAFVPDTKLWDTVELDLATGELAVLDTLPASIQSITQGSGAFDPATRRIFQVTGEGTLFAVDGDSGAFIGATALGPGDLQSVMNLQVNDAGELMGLAFGAVMHTVTIDSDTGVVTSLAELSPAQSSVSQGTGAFDPATNRIFELHQDGGLLVIDAATGALVGEVPVFGSSVIELAVNNAGELMGLRNDSFPNPWRTVRVDPLTGDVTDLGELSSANSFIQGQIVHDPAADHMFLLNSIDQVLVIDAGTGELVGTTTVVPGDHTTFLNATIVP